MLNELRIVIHFHKIVCLEVSGFNFPDLFYSFLSSKHNLNESHQSLAIGGQQLTCFDRPFVRIFESFDFLLVSLDLFIL